MSMFFGIVQSGLTLVVGQSYLGGRIAYIYQSGDPGYIAGEQHGFVVTATDVSVGAPWGCSGVDIGAYGLLLGDGKDNTDFIVSNCLTVGIAAYLVRNNLTPVGSWDLPAYGDFLKIWANRVAIGGLALANYWTSSETSTTQAYRIRTTDGLGLVSLRSTSYGVRGIRYF